MKHFRISKTFRLIFITMGILLGLALSGCGPDKEFGFQFFLADASGNPINGQKNITIDLYSSATAREADAPLFTETHNNVTVSNGLANLDIGSVADLDPSIFAQPLWMEVTVNGETLSPRQKLLGAPYAMSLVGGSVIGSGHAGDGSDGTDENYGSLSVIASGGSGTAMILGTSGDGDFIRACDNVIGSRTCPDLAFQLKNDGSVLTAANTKVAVSPLKIVQTTSTANYTIRLNSNGYATLRPTASGASYAYLPADLPSTLLGTPQKLKSIKVCYDLDTAASYISATYVYYTNTTLGRTTLISDQTDRKSTTTTCYTASVGTPPTILGPVYVRFDLQYGGTGSTHEIHIGQVTLTFTED